MTIRSSTPIFLAIWAGFICLGASAARADELRYTAVDLGTIVPDSRYVIAFDINNRGQVVGSVGTPSGHSVGFVTGTQGAGVRLVGEEVTGINESGATVGITTACNIQRACLGFVMGPRGHHAVHLNPPGATGGDTAKGLSAAGQAAGWAAVANEREHAYRTDPGGINVRDLGTLTGTYSRAQAINEVGQVCGIYGDDSNVERVFITDSQGVMRDAGFAGQCYGINALGQLVGSTALDGAQVAFVTGPDGRNMRTIENNEGVVSSALTAINRHGQAVGSELDFGTDYGRAVVTDQRTEHLYILDTLVTLPVSLRESMAINEHGQIAAVGRDWHVYLLTPIR